jgi:hypothetical protein
MSNFQISRLFVFTKTFSVPRLHFHRAIFRFQVQSLFFKDFLKIFFLVNNYSKFSKDFSIIKRFQRFERFCFHQRCTGFSDILFSPNIFKISILFSPKHFSRVKKKFLSETFSQIFLKNFFYWNNFQNFENFIFTKHFQNFKIWFSQRLFKIPATSIYSFNWFIRMGFRAAQCENPQDSISWKNKRFRNAVSDFGMCPRSPKWFRQSVQLA